MFPIDTNFAKSNVGRRVGGEVSSGRNLPDAIAEESAIAASRVFIFPSVP
jgi:hypothetical protein